MAAHVQRTVNKKNLKTLITRNSIARYSRQTEYKKLTDGPVPTPFVSATLLRCI